MPESTETWLRGTPEPPFRWNVNKREQLGRLVSSDHWPVWNELLTELTGCAARVVAFCDDGELFFVGRSADNLFDLLSGILAETTWEERLQLMPFSLGPQERPFARPEVRDALRRYLTSLELAPEQINSRPRPSVLVDVVFSGGTLGGLVETWHQWSEELGVPWVQLRRKLRIVGITERLESSPKTWRWQQHVSWTSLLPARSIRNVAISYEIWHHLANGPKASRSFPPTVWGDPSLARPLRDSAGLAGLRQASYIYDCGRIASVRERFVGELLGTPNVRQAWVRALAHELRARPHDLSHAEFARKDAEKEAERIEYARRIEERRAYLDKQIAETKAAAAKQE